MYQFHIYKSQHYASMVLHRKFHKIYGLVLVFVLSSCANYLRPFHTEKARLGTETVINKELKELPLPEDKAVVAVYRFRDQTGQYKETDNGASWSTAVTQGTTSILIRALEESGWFVPIEREDFANLLNERKVIQTVRAQYQMKNGEHLPPLPPLLYAGVILEGGVISYDTNILTGGAGARYLGIGASGKYRQDQVTIYLRATSTKSGKILKTVYTTKTILSEEVDAGIFRFVDTDKIFEGETGYSFNEPTTLAVTEAIQKAVLSLIVEGIHDGLWKLKNANDINSAIFQKYAKEKKDAYNYDSFGRHLTSKRSGLNLGMNFGMQWYQGNYSNPLLRSAGEVALSYNVDPSFSLGLDAGFGEIAARNAFEKQLGYLGLRGNYYILPFSSGTTYLTFGGGALWARKHFKVTNDVFPYLTGGIGYEQMLNRFLGINVEFRNIYPLEDGLDGIKSGNVNDMVWRAQVGMKFYLNFKSKR